MRSTSAGVEFILTFALPLAGGLWLDRWLGTKPVFVVIFFLLGMIAGFVEVFQIAKRASDRQD